MATETRTEEEIRSEIATERAALADSVSALRADVRARRRPLGRATTVVAAALGLLLIRRLARRAVGCCHARDRS